MPYAPSRGKAVKSLSFATVTGTKPTTFPTTVPVEVPADQTKKQIGTESESENPVFFILYNLKSELFYPNSHRLHS